MLLKVRKIKIRLESAWEEKSLQIRKIKMVPTGVQISKS
jgi:hypothetical protein